MRCWHPPYDTREQRTDRNLDGSRHQVLAAARILWPTLTALLWTTSTEVCVIGLGRSSVPGTRVAQELLSFSDPQLCSKGLVESPKWEAQSLQAIGLSTTGSYLI